MKLQNCLNALTMQFGMTMPAAANPERLFVQKVAFSADVFASQIHLYIVVRLRNRYQMCQINTCVPFCTRTTFCHKTCAAFVHEKEHMRNRSPETVYFIDQDSSPGVKENKSFKLLSIQTQLYYFKCMFMHLVESKHLRVSNACIQIQTGCFFLPFYESTIETSSIQFSKNGQGHSKGFVSS